MDVVIKDKSLYVSIPFLQTLGVKRNTIKVWRARKTGEWIKTGSSYYINFETIPTETKKKLPKDEYIRKTFIQKSLFEKVFKTIEEAYFLHHTRYRSFYETDSSLASEKVTRFSQLHAVFQAIIDLKESEGLRDLKTLYEAFNRLYPNKYTSKHALSNAIRKAMSDGIMSVALDKRVFGNNEASKKEQTPQIDYAVALLVSVLDPYFLEGFFFRV